MSKHHFEYIRYCVVGCYKWQEYKAIIDDEYTTMDNYKVDKSRRWVYIASQEYHF